MPEKNVIDNPRTALSKRYYNPKCEKCARLADFLKVVHHGSLHGIVGKVFPLDDVAGAHQAMEDRDFYGKLVIEN